jgi:NAD(P)-dependent dehydrogenase (short-subunit alcohol dehydrogenase family)
VTLTLKPLDEQVIVITGASSGIGLATVLAAATAGARVCWWRAAPRRNAVVAQVTGEGGEAPSSRAGTLYAADEAGRIRGRGNDNAADRRTAQASNLREPLGS